MRDTLKQRYDESLEETSYWLEKTEADVPGLASTQGDMQTLMDRNKQLKVNYSRINTIFLEIMFNKFEVDLFIYFHFESTFTLCPLQHTKLRLIKVFCVPK